MKCLYVTNIEHTIFLFFAPHIELLQNMGFDVTVATSIEDKQRIHKKLPGIKLCHIPFTRSIKSLRNIIVYRKLKKLMKQETYDLVHVHTPIAAFLTRLAAPKKQKVIYTAHGFHFHEKGNKISNFFFYLAEKFVAAKTSKIIVMNVDDLKNARRLFPVGKIQLIHGVGVDASYYNPENDVNTDIKKVKERLGIPAGVKIVTQVADIDENKRQIDVINAVEKLKERYQKFVVLLVGDGPLLHKMNQEILNRELEGFIYCLGYQRDIRDILSITDIGLLVSLREGLPKSIMEMMAMEIPVIATNIRGNRDLVKDKENGFLIPVKSPEQLMIAIHNLIKNDVMRKDMGANSRKKIIAKYDLKVILEKTKKIYESTLKTDEKGDLKNII